MIVLLLANRLSVEWEPSIVWYLAGIELLIDALIVSVLVGWLWS